MAGTTPAPILLLGDSGLLGQAFQREAKMRELPLRGASRSSADLTCDITDDRALAELLDSVRPGLVVNCAALVDVAACERNPGACYRINARPLVELIRWSIEHTQPFIQISTDHFYSRGGDRAHQEDEPVDLCNEYAVSKFLAEQLALTAPQALVLRTSIVGVRRWDRPTFAEWAIAAIEGDAPFTVFEDAYTSSIDVGTFTGATLDLAFGGAGGLLNLAAREVYSKADFVREMARQLGRTLDHAQSASVLTLTPPRPSCLGLNVRRAEGYLGRRLPGLTEVVTSVLAQRKEG